MGASVAPLGQRGHRSDTSRAPYASPGNHAMFDTLLLASTLAALAAGLGAGAIGVVVGAIADDALSRRADASDEGAAGRR